MKYTKTEPCSECPFRKKSLQGWLGRNSPIQMATDALSEVHLPCHVMVDYEDEDWHEKIYEDGSKVEHCAGARACAKKSGQLPRDETLRKMQEELQSSAIEECMDAPTFLNYHNNAPVKSWAMNTRAKRREQQTGTTLIFSNEEQAIKAKK